MDDSGTNMASKLRARTTQLRSQTELHIKSYNGISNTIIFEPIEIVHCTIQHHSIGIPVMNE